MTVNNDVSIAEIRTDIKYLIKNTDAINSKVDNAHEKMIVAEQATKTAHKRIDRIDNHIETKIEPHIEGYKKDRNKVIGIFAVISLGWAYIMKVWF